MKKMNTHLVHPTMWQDIVERYPNKLIPRMIIMNPDGRYLWQANNKTKIDVSNWLFYWNKDGKEYLKTIKDFCEMEN